MIAQHPAVLTVPETHYFRKVRGRMAKRSAGPFVSPRAAARVLDNLAEVAKVERPSLPRWWPLRGAYNKAFPRVMDRGAEAANAELWLEKSPVHLHYIEEIGRFVPDAIFLHLLRDGRDVVASLVDLCEREPDLWVPQLIPHVRRADRPELIAAAADRWNADISRSAVHRENADVHCLVTYEALVRAPAATLSQIATFLGLPYDSAMERHWESADDVVGHRRNQAHMEKTFKPLEDRRLVRFSQLFDDAEQRHVTELLHGGGAVEEALSQ